MHCQSFNGHDDRLLELCINAGNVAGGNRNNVLAECAKTVLIGLALLVVFFFSSRRRHTRYIGDWSSDVCSSDLRTWRPRARSPMIARRVPGANDTAERGRGGWSSWLARRRVRIALVLLALAVEIGRASCRERGEVSVGGVGVEKKGIWSGGRLSG